MESREFEWFPHNGHFYAFTATWSIVEGSVSVGDYDHPTMYGADEIENLELVGLERYDEDMDEWFPVASQEVYREIKEIISGSL